MKKYILALIGAVAVGFIIVPSAFALGNKVVPILITLLAGAFIFVLVSFIEENRKATNKLLQDLVDSKKKQIEDAKSTNDLLRSLVDSQKCQSEDVKSTNQLLKNLLDNQKTDDLIKLISEISKEQENISDYFVSQFDKLHSNLDKFNKGNVERDEKFSSKLSLLKESFDKVAKSQIDAINNAISKSDESRKKSLETLQSEIVKSKNQTMTLSDSISKALKNSDAERKTVLDNITSVITDSKNKTISALEGIKSGFASLKESNASLNNGIAVLTTKLGSESEIPDKIEEVGKEMQDSINEEFKTLIGDLKNSLERIIEDNADSFSDTQDSFRKLINSLNSDLKKSLDDVNMSVDRAMSTLKSSSKLNEEEAALMKSIEKIVK